MACLRACLPACLPEKSSRQLPTHEFCGQQIKAKTIQNKTKPIKQGWEMVGEGFWIDLEGLFIPEPSRLVYVGQLWTFLYFISGNGI